MIMLYGCRRLSYRNFHFSTNTKKRKLRKEKWEKQNKELWVELFSLVKQLSTDHKSRNEGVGKQSFHVIFFHLCYVISQNTPSKISFWGHEKAFSLFSRARCLSGIHFLCVNRECFCAVCVNNIFSHESELRPDLMFYEQPSHHWRLVWVKIYSVINISISPFRRLVTPWRWIMSKALSLQFQPTH